MQHIYGNMRVGTYVAQAPPTVVILADNYPQSAHTGRMNKRVGIYRSNLSGMCQVRTTGRDPHPLPPYTPWGYKFTLILCRLFVTRLKSTPLNKRTVQILPHREIWPLKTTGKNRFFTPNQPRVSALELFCRLTVSLTPQTPLTETAPKHCFGAVSLTC